jgi:hypothetical protein
MKPVSGKIQGLVLLAVLAVLPVSKIAHSQFQFNFAPQGTVVGSIANQTCPAGLIGNPGAGGMMGGGACDGTPFTQQVVNVQGGQYYHVIVGDGSGEFGLEYFIGTVNNGLCWFGCANQLAPPGVGMGGMMGGGVSPINASDGSATNDSAPLAIGNAGVGNPTRAAIFQFNRTAEMTQEFLKETAAGKPLITQTVTAPNMQLDFSMDMRGITYNDMNTPGILSLTQTINDPDIPAPGANPGTGAPLPDSTFFDIAAIPDTATVNITGGRFTYTPGGGLGGSLGTYNYFADFFDLYGTDWVQFCDPAQNPVSGCTTYGGVRGGMGGGGMGGGGGGGGGGMGGG